MHERQLHRARVVSSIAATVISLACGTNYVYSAWAPQFADKLHLSATQSNLIGAAGNLGMYTLGVPVGMFIDSRGPRPAVIAGSILLGLGYFPIKLAFDAGSGSIALLCIFSYLTGLGGCMAFAAAVKTSALNWPRHRGTATAFPLAAFGLSAFFFSVVGGALFPADTSGFLLALAIGTFGLPFIGFFFLRVYAHSSYHAVSSDDSHRGPQVLRRTSSEEAKYRARAGDFLAEPGTSPISAPTASKDPAQEVVEGNQPRSAGRSGDGEADVESSAVAPTAESDGREPDETSSLMSTSSSMPGEIVVQSSVDMDRSHRVDIRGWKLLKNVEFWQFWCIMGILSGIGLMTINNIGHDANALWKHWDDSVSEEFLVYRQQMHVSILSIGSFAGRLLSGVGSDFLVKVLKASRVWCLAVASLIFCLAQVCALTVLNPHLLGFVSGLSGLGYGFLFGVFPSIVAETFGIHGLSQNWGFMTLSPVLSSNIFNLFYGAVYDRHSVVEPDGTRSCLDGIDCYRSAYFVTLGACGLGLIVTLWVIHHQHRQREKEAKGVAQD